MLCSGPVFGYNPFELLTQKKGVHKMSVHSTTERIMVAIEMSNKKWRLAFSTSGDRKIRQKSIQARNRTAFMSELALAKEKLGVSPEATATSCYEAGRDG